jgi:hypothetical protein
MTETSAETFRGGTYLPRFRPVGAAMALVTVLAVGLLGCSDDDDAGGEGAAGGTTSTSLETGGIAVAAPDGWRAIPLPQLGFGVAVPEDWEAVVLSDDVLADLATASPAVPGFLDAAHAASQTGSVFYAAGVDDQERVTDLKVRALTDAAVTDVAGLEDVARQLAADEGLAEPEVAPVEGAAVPTVEMRYETTSQRPADGSTTTTSGQATTTEPALVDVNVRGTERLALGPRGVVYSLIVTSEDVPGHDSLATRLLDTLAFPSS